jgi:hypothetical protein
MGKPPWKQGSGEEAPWPTAEGDSEQEGKDLGWTNLEAVRRKWRIGDRRAG